MANQYEKEQAAVFGAQIVLEMAGAGLADADVSGLANAAALVTKLQTVRDRAGTKQTTHDIFEAGIQNIQWLITQGVINDTNAAALATVKANNGLTTDLLVLVSTNAPTSPTTYDITRQEVPIFGPISVAG